LRTQVVKDYWQLLLNWSVQNSKGHSGFLEISGTRLGSNLLGLGSDFESPNVLDDWDSEVDTFSVDFWKNSSSLVENEGSVSTINNKAELVGEESSEGHETSCANHSVK
jgi:hypothetical protein